jgi:hypothetical protein
MGKKFDPDKLIGFYDRLILTFFIGYFFIILPTLIVYGAFYAEKTGYQ